MISRIGSGRSSKNKVFIINLTHLICFLPLVLFNFYKNGYLLIDKGYITIFGALQYIFIPIVIVFLSYIFEIYYYIGIKKENNTNNVVNSVVPHINLLCYLVSGPIDKLYIIVPIIMIVDILMRILENKFIINRVALYKCLLFGILILFGIYNNMNLWEFDLNSKYLLNNDIADLLIGLRVGEMGAVSNILVILGFVVLLFNKYYKKDIPISAFIAYILTSGLLVLIGTISGQQLLAKLLNSSILFIFIYIAPISDASPITRTSRIIYGLVLGILTSIIINILDMNIGVYIILLILSMLCPLFNKIKFSYNR